MAEDTTTRRKSSAIYVSHESLPVVYRSPCVGLFVGYILGPCGGDAGSCVRLHDDPNLLPTENPPEVQEKWCHLKVVSCSMVVDVWRFNCAILCQKYATRKHSTGKMLQPLTVKVCDRVPYSYFYARFCLALQIVPVGSSTMEFR